MGDIHRCLALLFAWTAATLIKNTGTSQKPWEPYGMKMLTAGSRMPLLVMDVVGAISELGMVQFDHKFEVM